MLYGVDEIEKKTGVRITHGNIRGQFLVQLPKPGRPFTIETSGKYGHAEPVEMDKDEMIWQVGLRCKNFVNFARLLLDKYCV